MVAGAWRKLLAGGAEATAQSTRPPVWHSAPALNVSKNTPSIDDVTIKLVVSSFEILVVRELNKGVAPGLSLLVLHDTNLLDCTNGLHFAFELCFSRLVRQSGQEEGVIRLFRCLGVLFWFPCKRKGLAQVRLLKVLHCTYMLAAALQFLPPG